MPELVAERSDGGECVVSRRSWLQLGAASVARNRDPVKRQVLQPAPVRPDSVRVTGAFRSPGIEHEYVVRHPVLRELAEIQIIVGKTGYFGDHLLLSVLVICPVLGESVRPGHRELRIELSVGVVIVVLPDASGRPTFCVVLGIQ